MRSFKNLVQIPMAGDHVFARDVMTDEAVECIVQSMSQSNNVTTVMVEPVIRTYDSLGKPDVFALYYDPDNRLKRA